MPNKATEINSKPALQFSLRSDFRNPARLHTARDIATYRKLCDAGLMQLLGICWDFGLTEGRAFQFAEETRIHFTTNAQDGESLEIRIARDAVKLVHPAGSDTVIAEERKRDPSGADRLRMAAMRRLALPN